MVELKYIAVFFALLVTDMVWALYIRWSAEGRPILAGIASVLIYVVGAFTIGEFIKDVYILIPASLGCFTGTYLTIKFLG